MTALERLLSLELWLQVLGKTLEISLVLLGAWIALAISRRILERALWPMRRVRPSEAAERRARTLLMMGQSLIKYIVLAATILIVLGRLGVPTGSLLTGGAIIGVAVTFGAQNLIRDFFTGLALLIEDAFTIGDRITIAGISGEVVEMGMRMVKLRGEDGTLHFVPYGAIQAVSNMSRGGGTPPPASRVAPTATPAADEEPSAETVMEK